MSTVHEESKIERKDTEYHRRLVYRDPQHTPYNKRPYEEVSTMKLEVEAHRKAEWLTIFTEEARTNKANDVRFIGHSITLRPEQALALRDMLNEQFPVGA